MLEILPVGDIGTNRFKLVKLYNTKIGESNWFWGFYAGKCLYSWDIGMQLYEDAYWNFFRNNKSVLKDVVCHKDVYLIDREDIESGLDYKKQKGREEHYEDIAVRRCLRRFGIWFNGKNDKLYSIGSSPLSSQIVNFHLQHLIKKGDDNSVYSWFNGHRVVIIATEIEDQYKLSKMLIR